MSKSGNYRPIILTTDCGTEVDDQWALAHLALSPELDLRGVVTTHAPNLPPPAAESSSKAVRDVLSHLPLSVLPPVYAGSSVALIEKNTALLNEGVEFIIEEARAHSSDGRLAVLTIGAATDVASALIADPTIADRIEVVAMGFASWEEGGREWNVQNDGKAWQVILESKAEIVIGCAQVAIRDLKMSGSKASELFAGRGVSGDYLSDMLVNWVTTNPELMKQVTGCSDSWPMWDQITVAHLLGAADHQSRPRPVLKDDLSFEHSDEGVGSDQTVRWITSVDAPSLWQDFASKLV